MKIRFHPKQLRMLEEISKLPELMEIIAEKRGTSIECVRDIVTNRAARPTYHDIIENKKTFNDYRECYLTYIKKQMSSIKNILTKKHKSFFKWVINGNHDATLTGDECYASHDAMYRAIRNSIEYATYPTSYKKYFNALAKKYKSHYELYLKTNK